MQQVEVSRIVIKPMLFAKVYYFKNWKPQANMVIYFTLTKRFHCLVRYALPRYGYPYKERLVP